MSIGSRSGVTGKMFAAARDPLPSHCFIECAGISNDLFDGLAVATAAQRIIGIIIERNVEHRTKIEVETKKSQQSPRNLAVPADKIDVAFIA